MVKRNIVILDIDYVSHEDKAVIRLFAKGENGKEIIVIDDSFEPYLYVEPAYGLEEAILDIETLDVLRIEEIEKKDFQIPKQFLKVFFNHPQDIPKNRDDIRDFNSVKDIREHDIPFYRRYLIDNDLVLMSNVEIEGDLLDSFSTINSNNKNLEIIKLTKTPKTIGDYLEDFKILSFDLEVYNPHGMPNPQNDEIIMIGVSSNFGINKVISTKSKINSDDSFVECVVSEKEMIESFLNLIKESNLDIIVGYNSDNFDFPYIKKRAKLLGIDLDLGMDGSSLKFIKRGYAEAANIKGLLHIDLYLLMRRYMSLDRYTLERVYFELFNEEKIDVPGDLIYRYWDSDGEQLNMLFDYSLDDVVATLKIAQQILPLNLELTRIVGQPFFDLSRMTTGQQAEWFLVKKAHEYNEMVPNKPSGDDLNQRQKGNNVGGYVKEPEKGLHENLVQFDFRSLYPSLIISKNISPDALVKKDLLDFELDDSKYNISPEHGHIFVKEPQAFIPSVIGEVLSERLKIKAQLKKSEDSTEKKFLDVQQAALKRLANTMYGVYGYSRFRWYSFECAQAITAWGRNYIKHAMDKAESYGFHTIYADTDGFYVKYIQ